MYSIQGISPGFVCLLCVGVCLSGRERRIVLNRRGIHINLDNFSKAFWNTQGDGIMVSIEIGHSAHHNTGPPLMDASATILRSDASWQLMLPHEEDVYFGYVWAPQDNLRALDCCYYMDGGTNSRVNAMGQMDRCYDDPSVWHGPPVMCERDDIEISFPAHNGCISLMLETAKQHSCPHCWAENEAVMLRYAYEQPIQTALDDLSMHTKPWPVALVLSYVACSVSSGSEVAAKLRNSLMLRRREDTFAAQTLVLVVEQQQVTWSRKNTNFIVPPRFVGLVRLDRLVEFLDTVKINSAACSRGIFDESLFF